MTSKLSEKSENTWVKRYLSKSKWNQNTCTHKLAAGKETT